jgi:hypothetical protein
MKPETLGNIRLIAELFNKEVVRKPIVHACVGELAWRVRCRWRITSKVRACARIPTWVCEFV